MEVSRRSFCGHLIGSPAVLSEPPSNRGAERAVSIVGSGKRPCRLGVRGQALGRYLVPFVLIKNEALQPGRVANVFPERLREEEFSDLGPDRHRDLAANQQTGAVEGHVVIVPGSAHARMLPDIAPCLRMGRDSEAQIQPVEIKGIQSLSDGPSIISMT